MFALTSLDVLDSSSACFFVFRFAYPGAVKQLPIWVQPHVNKYDTFGAAVKDIMLFFKTAEKTVSNLAIFSVLSAGCLVNINYLYTWLWHIIVRSFHSWACFLGPEFLAQWNNSWFWHDAKSHPTSKLRITSLYHSFSMTDYFKNDFPHKCEVCIQLHLGGCLKDSI